MAINHDFPISLKEYFEWSVNFHLLIMYPRILWKARQIFRVEKVSHNVPGARLTEKKKKNFSQQGI